VRHSDPGFDPAPILAALDRHYGIEAGTIDFIPAGYDLHAASYRVTDADGEAWFAKVRFDGRPPIGLEIAAGLAAMRAAHIAGPLRSQSGSIATPLEELDAVLVLYPFIDGAPATETRLSAEQWRDFGTALRAVHDSSLLDDYQTLIPREAFALPCATDVRAGIVLARKRNLSGPSRQRLATLLRERTSQLKGMLEQATVLGRALDRAGLPFVLCHGDIHAANILVGTNDDFWLVDWDAPLAAPRERDLLFVAGSRIARRVEPEEEQWFFEGYGPVEIACEALVYFRYERVLQDIAEIAKSVFTADRGTEETRAAEVDLVEKFFAPGGIIEAIERLR
jgi:spectinomycin phosphotransferase